MKFIKILGWVLFGLASLGLVLSFFMPMGGLGSAGNVTYQYPYEVLGEHNYFVTPSGTGNCLSWETACTFVTAMDKCVDDEKDNIFLSPGTHDTDDGVGGYIIGVSDVRIIGSGESQFGGSILANANAGATHILQTDSNGDNVAIENLRFTNDGQTDENVIHLYLNGSTGGRIDHVAFTQTSGAGGTGVLFENSASDYHFHHVEFQGLVDACYKTNGATEIEMNDACFCRCGTKGVHIAGASDANLSFFDVVVRYTTTLGIDNDAATGSNILFHHVDFLGNADNVDDDGDYGVTRYVSVHTDTPVVTTYPVTTGTALSTGDGAWTWTVAPTQVIPPGTFAQPFRVTGFNVQTITDGSQQYSYRLYYGEAAADNLFYQGKFYAEAAGSPFTQGVFTSMETVALPAGSGIWVATASSTAGVDVFAASISVQEY